jgi:hypothetical protein
VASGAKRRKRCGRSIRSLISTRSCKFQRAFFFLLFCALLCHL